MVEQMAAWEKLEGESAKAYAAFAVYRDTSPSKRSLRDTCVKFYGGSPVNLRQIEAWSSAHRWVERAAAYDAERDRLARQEREELAEEARDRARRSAQLLQSIALKGLRTVNDGRLGRAGVLEPETNPPISLLRYLREGVELEFVALGLPISVQRQQIEREVQTPEDLEHAEKLDTLRRATAALRRA